MMTLLTRVCHLLHILFSVCVFVCVCVCLCVSSLPPSLLPPSLSLSLALSLSLSLCRQSQVNFNSENAHTLFPDFAHAHALEVILSPGDVLYVPPFWFHYVSVVGESVRYA